LPLPANWLPLLVVMTSSTLIGMTMSFSFPLLSLVLERDGVPADLIGLNAAAFGLAIFTIAPWLPRIVNRLGPVPCMAIGQSLCLVCLLLFPLKVDLAWWAALRFALGLGTVLSWVSSETAVNALAREEQRGRIIGFYATLFCVGYAAGPALIMVTGSAGWRPFLAAAGVLLLGILPLALARGAGRAVAEPGTVRLMRIWRLAPLALGAILVFGLVETSGFALIPLYGLALGYDEAGAVFLLSLLIAGNVLFQLPIGWLADRASRPRVLLGCALLSLLCLLAWPVAVAVPLLGWPLLFVTGGVLGGLYTLSMTLIGQQFRGTDLAVANTAFVLMYQAGAIIGPALGGVAMATAGAQSLPLTLALTLALFLGLAVATARLQAPLAARRGDGGGA
jgi:MFS family permease